mgnify:CR=1 FL=1
MNPEQIILKLDKKDIIGSLCACLSMTMKDVATKFVNEYWQEPRRLSSFKFLKYVFVNKSSPVYTFKATGDYFYNGEKRKFVSNLLGLTLVDNRIIIFRIYKYFR